MKTSYIYLLLCADDSYYVGVTSNLEQRIERHQTGYYPKSYTHSRLPVKLVYHEIFNDIKIAIKREKQIKRWSHAKKKALIEGELGELKKASMKEF